MRWLSVFRSPLLSVLLFGAVVYFFLASLTHHPDNKQVLQWAGAEGGAVWDIWRYGQTHYSKESQFNYPPGHFYLDKAQYFLARVIGGDQYDQWLRSSHEEDAHQSQLPRFAVATKSGLILTALVVAYAIFTLVRRHGGSEHQAWLAAAIWLFNPVTLYSVPIMGQNDVLAIAVFFLGWLLLRRKWLGAAVLFGLAISVKTFPVIWLPFLLMADPDLKWKRRLAIVAVAVSTFALTLAPFISNATFRDAVLDSNLNDRFLYAQINFGFEQAISVIPILLLVLLVAVSQRSTATGKSSPAVSQPAFILMTVNLLLLGFTHFHPQWWTWVMCFLAVWVVFQNQTTQVWTAVLGSLSLIAWLVVILLFNDRFLAFGLFMPLNPSLINLPIMRDYFAMRGMNIIHNLNLVHTWLAGVAIVALWQVLTGKVFLTTATKAGQTQGLVTWWLQKPRWLRKTLWLGLMGGSLIFLTVITWILPAPAASMPPRIASYEPLGPEMSVTWTESAPRLNRLDFFLKNSDLRNRDEFVVDLRDQGSNVLFTQTFTGFNVGDPDTLRFDFPAQADSQGKVYQAVIFNNTNQTLTKDELAVGVIDTATTSTRPIAVQRYYQAPGLLPRLQQGLTHVLAVAKSLPLFYGLLLVLLLLM